MPPKDVPKDSIGSDARNVPPTGDTTNETTPPEQRLPSRTKELSSGPQIGENGEYKPARYKQERGFSRGENMPPVIHEVLIEDF